MRHCNQCILPENYPGISFDENGVCNFCRDYQPHHEYLGKEKLIEVLTSRVKTGPYHCVVPISGGKDSTFILYYIVKELRLNPIAVTYDSGFQVEVSRENIKNTCDVLGVPLIVVKSPGDIASKLLKESLLVSERVGRFWYQCINCEAIIRTVSINVAKTHKAPFVIWGSSALESLDNKNYENYKNLGIQKKVPAGNFLGKTLSKINALALDPGKIKKIPAFLYSLIGYHVIKFNILSISQRLRMHFPYQHAFNPHSVPPFSVENPRFIHFFDYITWDSIKNIKLLEDELKWKHPVDKDSRFDCEIHCLSNYQFLKSRGITSDGANLCNFIREKKIDREVAMNIENHFIESVEIECNELINRFELKDYRMPKAHE